MASSSGSASIEDVLEDLELQHALLQSLMETRPDAVAEKEEIIQTIKRLEKKLARLRGDRSGNTAVPSSYLTASASEGPRGLPQMDGSSDSGMQGSPSIPRWGGSQQASLHISQGSPSSRPRERVSEPADSRFLQPLSTRKRPHDDADLGHMPGEFPEHSFKRPAPAVPRSVSSTPSSPSVRDSGEGPSRSSNTLDELQRLLGFDSDTLLAMQREQMEAERWLEQRREQERRDAELARRLQEGWQQESRPASAANSPAPSHSALDSAHMPPPRSRDLAQTPVDRVPTPSPLQSPSSHRPNSGNSAMLPPPLPVSGQSTPQRPPSAFQFDSSDSDIAEITPQDFQRRTQGLFTGPSSRPEPFRDTASSSAYPWADAEALSGRTNLLDPLNSRNRDLPGSSRIVPFGPRYTSQTGIGSSTNTWYGSNVLQNTMATLNAGRSPFNAPGQGQPLSNRFPSSYSLPSFSQLHNDLFSAYSGSLGYTPDPEMDLLRYVSSVPYRAVHFI